MLSKLRDKGPDRDALSTAPRRLASGVGGFLKGASRGGVGAVRWTGGQIRGTVDNVRAFADWFAFDRFMPPSIADLITYTFRMVPRALGLRGTRRERMLAASTQLIAVAILSSFVTLGATLIIVVILGFFWLVALLRFIPAFNDGWGEFTDELPFQRDQDVPLWTRE